MGVSLEAIKKINAEMQKRADDPYVEIIGHYVIARCEEEACAALVLADGKTLGGAMQVVTATAQKVKKGNVAVLTQDRVFGEVDRYFSLPTNVKAQQRVLAGLGTLVEVEKEKPVLSLTDFL